MIPKKGMIIFVGVFVLVILVIIIAGGRKHDRDSKAVSQEIVEILAQNETKQDGNKDAHGAIAVAQSGTEIMAARYMYVALMGDKKIWLDHTYDFLLAAPMAIPAPLLLIFFAWRRQS